MPAPGTRCVPRQSAVARVSIAASAPGACCTPQSRAPPMKHAGMRMRAPAKASISMFVPVKRVRYQLSPPWKPLRPYSSA